jgi:hypothetical protein
LPLGRSSTSGAGSGLDDLFRRPEPFEYVADRDLAGSVFLAQRRLDVLADLRDQLCAP